MKKYGIATISSLFFVYGGFRLVVASLLLLHFAGVYSNAELQEGVEFINSAFEDKFQAVIITFSAEGYVSYLWVMAALLVVGAIGCFKRNRIGEVCISLFLILYVFLFVNFLTINPKVLHLLAVALLFGVYFLLKRNEQSNGNQHKVTGA